MKKLASIFTGSIGYVKVSLKKLLDFKEFSTE